MTISTSDLRVRDPYIVVNRAEGCYYLYKTAQRAGDAEMKPNLGVDCFVSRDLESWDGPQSVFRPPAGFWATRDFWAPEVHYCYGHWYLFLSMKAEGRCRATQILVGNSALGPFAPLSGGPGGLDGPATPRDWECLDGTLWIEDGKPWMVFCHEWVQIADGTICAMPLKDDLSDLAGPATPEGRPIELFRATQAPWVRSVSHPVLGDKPGYVTDAPWLHRSPGGELLMLWSSMGEGGYSTGIARSQTGKITGPWTHDPQPLFGKDGGHCMLFRRLDGQLIMALHQPNGGRLERARFLPLAEKTVAGRETLSVL